MPERKRRQRESTRAAAGATPEAQALARSLEQRIGFERSLAEISARLMRASAGQLDPAIEEALGEIGRFFDVDRAYVFRIPESRRTMSNTHEWVAPGVTREAAQLQGVPVETFPWLMAELSADQAVAVSRVATLPAAAAAERAEFEREGIRSLVIVPMRRGADLAGFVGFDAVRREVDWTEQYVLGLRLLAQILAGALETHELAARLTEMAFHDPLTDLPNRKLLGDRLAQAASRARRDGGEIAVLLLDLDDFKLVNDRFGHAAGDQLLCEVARRLRARVGNADTLARLGGDEFVVVVEDNLEGPPQELAQRLLAAFAEPFELEQEPIVLHSSIGIVRGRGGTLEPGEILRAADVAMYAAKAAGKNRFALFDPAMDRDAGDDPGLRFQLGRALSEGELRLHLQPLVELSSGRLAGAEGLVRWQHPLRGLLPPARFLPLAERSSLVCAIDRWALSRAAALLASDSLAGGRLAINLSARELRDRDQFDVLLALLARLPLPSAKLELELTEGLLLEDLPGAVARLREMKRQAPGLRLAIDDFGRGYSSLHYLNRLPVDTLKIDRSFVADLTDRERNSVAIVRSIVELGHNLGLLVVAEGVESAEQARLLADLGCDQGQGFHFSEPLSEEALARFLTTR